MTGTSAIKSQPDIFRPLLTDFIDTDQELAVLADRIDWDYFEQAFAGQYSHTDQPPCRFALWSGACCSNGSTTMAMKAWMMIPYMRQSHP